ncbi:hypothetical protein GGX14DRAFT_406766 [Mycena pura]|uniref:Uncharacterized protein n=1 Tax=Mycena pura TaxID=153505 RepID=A0AAD6URA0_9AGAR|nr:hypothetical protein GGX14DRAFT_406766 [Mycena pura]
MRRLRQSRAYVTRQARMSPTTGVTGGAGHTPIPRTAGFMQWVALLVTFINNEACSCIAFVKGGPHACIALDNAEPQVCIAFDNIKVSPPVATVSGEARVHAARVIGEARVPITFVTGKARARVAFDTGKRRGPHAFVTDEACTCVTFITSEFPTKLGSCPNKHKTRAKFHVKCGLSTKAVGQMPVPSSIYGFSHTNSSTTNKLSLILRKTRLFPSRVDLAEEFHGLTQKQIDILVILCNFLKKPLIQNPYLMIYGSDSGAVMAACDVIRSVIASISGSGSPPGSPRGGHVSRHIDASLRVGGFGRLHALNPRRESGLRTATLRAAAYTITCRMRVPGPSLPPSDKLESLQRWRVVHAAAADAERGGGERRAASGDHAHAPRAPSSSVCGAPITARTDGARGARGGGGPSRRRLEITRAHRMRHPRGAPIAARTDGARGARRGGGCRALRELSRRPSSRARGAPIAARTDGAHGACSGSGRRARQGPSRRHREITHVHRVRHRRERAWCTPWRRTQSMRVHCARHHRERAAMAHGTRGARAAADADRAGGAGSRRRREITRGAPIPACTDGARSARGGGGRRACTRTQSTARRVQGRGYEQQGCGREQRVARCMRVWWEVSGRCCSSGRDMGTNGGPGGDRRAWEPVAGTGLSSSRKRGFLGTRPCGGHGHDEWVASARQRAVYSEQRAALGVCVARERVLHDVSGVARERVLHDVSERRWRVKHRVQGNLRMNIFCPVSGFSGNRNAASKGRKAIIEPVQASPVSAWLI